MFCISVSFKKTPLPVRQRFAFSKEEQEHFLFRLMEKQEITGGVVVSTCNRSELYFTGTKENVDEVENQLSLVKTIEKEQIKKYGLYYQGKKAVQHLFRVVCGLDSMVLGEDEILHQVKEAYLFAKSNGYTNGELNIIFQSAFNCAKLSKNKTRLSSTPLSVGTLTAKVVEEYLKAETGKTNQRVLVIGATGKIGSIVAKDLLAKGILVMGTSRKRCSAEGTFLWQDNHMEWLDFEHRYDVVDKVMAIVSATASPHYTLTKEEFFQHTKRKKRYLLIDLAVPYDIDKQLGAEEKITLLDVDYFKALAKQNNTIRIGELEKAESILNACVEETLKKLYIRKFRENMQENGEGKQFWKMLGYLRDSLDSDQLFTVLQRMERGK